MALIRWEPVRGFHTVQTDWNRLFNTFFDTPTHSGGGSLRRWVPATDLAETETEYVLRADLPGLSEDDVTVELNENILTISGERRSESEERKEGYYRVERSSGRFSRSLTLPEGVESDSISANFDRGVLEVRIAKPAEKQPRKVAITVGSGPKAIGGSEAAPTTGAAPTTEAA